MDVNINRLDHTLKVVITGRLSGDDAYKWYNSIMDALGDDVTEVIINLAGVNYLTSASLRGIILLQKEMDKRDGELVLEDPQEMIFEILDATGMTRFLDIRKTS